MVKSWSISLSPGNRGCPSLSSPNMQPTDHMSTAFPYGALQANVWGGMLERAARRETDTVVKVAAIPEQELWRAVPSSGHVLGVISISSLWETACEAWQRNTQEAIRANEEVFIGSACWDTKNDVHQGRLWRLITIQWSWRRTMST